MLIASPQFPFPMIDGGKIANGNTLIGLSNFFDITYLCNSPNKVTNEHLNFAKRYCKPIIINKNVKNTIPKIFLSLFYDHPLIANKFCSKEYKEKFLELIKKEKYDIIHLEHSFMFYLLESNNINFKENYVIGTRFHNVEYQIWKRYAQKVKNKLKYTYISNQAQKVKEIEKKALKHSDVSFSISKIDKKELNKILPKSHIINIFPGVDTSLWKPKRDDINQYEIIIGTNYQWIHNVDGLVWFIENVFPKIKKTFPQTKLTLLGSNMDHKFDKYKSQNVNPVGFVDDVKPYYNKANVYITPLFVGSGIRIKILEAMAMELPVVSTKVGAEGIETHYSNGLYVTDSANQFAQAIIDLFQHNETRIEIGKKARKYIEENFSLDKGLNKIAIEYQRLLKKKSRSKSIEQDLLY